MSFLNDTLEYKETCSSLRFPNRKDTAQVMNNLFAPLPSFSNSPMNNSNDCTDSENRPPSTAPLPSFSNSPMNNSNDCTDSENRPPSTPSPSISELSVATSALRKRQHSSNIDEVDRAFLQTLNTSVQPNPIDGFMLRLAEGMRRLPYRERSQLELEFLIKLRETEERLGLLNN
ncbi:histone H3 [Temnothorax longispinosus]|uniref:Histone H3 n=1 Tax=Temnothorax longispinosus TaxID=300112 RepID=A0A4S2KJ85_9HYME|nr:histone H3 [Temnothorax longispinosus]